VCVGVKKNNTVSKPEKTARTMQNRDSLQEKYPPKRDSFAKKCTQKRDSLQKSSNNATHCKKNTQKRDSLQPKTRLFATQNATHLQIKLNRDSFAIVIVAIGACWCWCTSHNEGHLCLETS